jgi:hypothetical protein
MRKVLLRKQEHRRLGLVILQEHKVIVTPDALRGRA